VLIGKREIERMIPHAGAMCLLDRVVAWDAERIQCVALSHHDRNNPLRSGGKLRAVCGIEYASQAMAVHGALNGAVERKPPGGYLASVRDLVCKVERLDAGSAELFVDAQRVMGDAERVIYRFSVRVGDTQALSGRATVVLDIGGAQ
jgi:predicted hotdog family 3-hydroxylacyl-ACP dehydratase